MDRSYDLGGVQALLAGLSAPSRDYRLEPLANGNARLTAGYQCGHRAAGIFTKLGAVREIDRAKKAVCPRCEP